MNLSNTNNSGTGVGFQRIRRVTGYLTDDVKFMNDSKKAEVAERVKHASVNSTIYSKSSKPDSE